MCITDSLSVPTTLGYLLFNPSRWLHAVIRLAENESLRLARSRACLQTVPELVYEADGLMVRYIASTLPLTFFDRNEPKSDYSSLNVVFSSLH